VIARSPGGLDVGRAVAIVEQLAATLDAAHRTGLVHGDVRPANVWLVDEQGRETARLSEASRPAPAGADPRSDVYGLGALLFEALTGRGPFSGPPARAVDLRPGLPAALEPVFARALARAPSERYASAGEFASAARATAGSPGGSQGRLAFALAGFAAILVVGAAIAAVVLLTSGGDDGGDRAERGATPETPATPAPPGAVENPVASAPAKGPAVPPVAEKNLGAAAAAAGCTVKTLPEEGKQHSPDPADWVYKSNPPTSGTHAPTWADDGVYPYGSAPAVGFTTHALEHGRIDIQYGPKLTRAQFDQLQTLMAEDDGYHQLLFENQTKMPGTLAATAWTQMLSCPSFTPKVFDALRAFKKTYTDKGPEAVP
jgi:Protein of unknown function (DUF3105)